MSRIALTGILIALATASCNQDDQSETAVHFGQTGLKPTVAIVPVIDSTKTDLDWNLSDEFSSEIYYTLSQSNNFSLVSPNKVYAATKKLHDSQNPFGADVSWIKKAFLDDEFVVFLELIKHEEVLRQDRKQKEDPQNCSADLNMSIRVRVFDLRNDQPKIVLQELIHDSHFIPCPFTQINFYQSPWKDQSFEISPMGLAHTQFIKQIASRLKEYILLSSDD